MKKVFAVHTAMAMVEPTNQLFKEHLPNVKLYHIADDSLIQEVIANNKVTPEVRRRLFKYYFAAVDGGADVIFNTCSSIGEVAIMARDFISVPLVKIDDAMAKKAVGEYKKIGVLATLPTTLAPTMKLLTSFMNGSAGNISLEKGLADGAFQAMMSGDGATHDSIILKTAKKLADKVDAFVLAQGSMARMADELSKITEKPVLSSPTLGTLSVKQILSNI